MTKDVDTERLSGVRENNSAPLVKLRVLLFCMKHPRLNFTTDCIAVNKEVDKVVLEEEIQNLISSGILDKQISDSGITYYRLNRTEQELVELTEKFMKDLHLQESGIRAEGN